MNEYTLVKLAVIAAAFSGFVAGKLNIDQRIKAAIERENLRRMQLGAQTFADELESRRLLPIPRTTPTAVKDSPACG